jgi:hypothetical protein
VQGKHSCQAFAVASAFQSPRVVDFHDFHDFRDFVMTPAERIPLIWVKRKLSITTIAPTDLGELGMAAANAD